MLNLPHNGIAPDMLGEVRPLLGVVGLDKARQELEHTEVPESVGRYIVAVGRRTRELPGVELGVSSRAMIHLVNATKANARLNGRTTTTIEDVREMAPTSSASHRRERRHEGGHRAARRNGVGPDGRAPTRRARSVASGRRRGTFGPSHSLAPRARRIASG